MPEGMRDAIRTQITTLSALGCDVYEIAAKVQDIWPGCGANNVRGVIAGLKSAEMGGNSGFFTKRAESRRRMKQPWSPGQPKPERGS